MSKCPIKALEGLLIKHDVISESEKKQIQSDVEEAVDEALVFAKESPYPDESGLLNNVFKS